LNYLEISNVNNRGIISENEIRELFFLDAPSRARRIVRNGDTVISSVRPNLQALAYIKHTSGNLIASTGFYVVTPNQKRLDEKYTYYLLISDGSRQHLEAVAKGVGYPAVDDKDFITLKFSIPSLEEQRRIAAYLDKTCAAIDKVIEAKQKQLAILDALRKSIIHKAVTRGLDDSVELKDSGVEWLGRIPRHWKVRRIKDIVALNSGDSITSDSITLSGNYPVFGGNGLRGFTTSYTHDGYHVLIGRQGALCGNINYTEGKFWASEHAVVATTLTRHDTFWLGELLRVMNLNQYSNAAAQPGLAVEKIKFLQLPVPSYEEQHHIASFIRGKIVKNEELVSDLQNQISTLEQYRKSLIHECVTGKRKITEDDVNGQL
jgi:type I restriction enzyme S subunit